jgi:hypothetical protein
MFGKTEKPKVKQDTTGLWNIGVRVMVFNATFNNISVKSSLSVLLVRSSVILLLPLFYWWRKPPTCCKALTNFFT